MTTVASTAAAYSLAVHLETADLVASTTMANAGALNGGEVLRTFVGFPNWAFGTATTAQSDAAPLVFGYPRPEEPIVAELLEFRRLEAGWDGETAAKPDPAAVRDAIRFVRSVGDTAEVLEPTLHVDGSVILELDGGAAGSFRFKGDGQVIYSTDQMGNGVAPVVGFVMPSAIRSALAA